MDADSSTSRNLDISLYKYVYGRCVCLCDAHLNLALQQFGEDVALMSFVDPTASDIASSPSPLWSKLRGLWRRAVYLKRRFTHRNRPRKIDI